jgi:hypothetical protein
VCGVIAKDAGRPEDICAQLTPRYLSGYKLATCVSEWKQLSAETEDDCAAAAPGRPSWYHRCQEYARFKTAYRAKDASLCQGGEVCLALMGRWQGEIAKRYAEKIEAGFCGSMDSYARAEKERVVALLAQLQSYLDSGAVSPEQKPEKASELAALRVRLEGLTAAR